MDLRTVLLYALNHQCVTGYAFDRDSLDVNVQKLFEDNGVDIDAVVKEVEENEDGLFDLY